jgi:predicted RNase H-like nuclease (RuvC/YqgF family)
MTDKQENFELNPSYVQVVDRYREEISDLRAIVKRLKAENEELKQTLEKIKVITLDIIENDCYENSDTKAKKIIDIIYPLLLTDKEKQEAKELAEKISKYPEDFNI